MSVKPETKVRRKLDKLLSLLPNSVWFTIQQITKCGDPDKIGAIRCRDCGAAKFVAVEVKATSRDEPTPLQGLKLSRIEAVGGMALVAHNDNLDEVMEVLSGVEANKKRRG